MGIEGSRARRALLAGLCASLVAPARAKPKATAAVLDVARDLPRDLVAHADAEVVLLMFSLPDCPYCEAVRRNYLASLTRDPVWALRLLVREVGLDDRAALVDFDGSGSSGAALARRYGAKVAPTVVFLDRRGQSLADPLIGGDIAGFYGAYLDAALGRALGPNR